MATSMWRMNGPCRRMTGLVVLCTLLLSSVVMCQQTAATNASAESTSATVGADVSPATAPVSTANDNAATGSPSPVTTATQETTILIDSGSSKIVQAPAGPAIVKITEVTETQTDPSAPPSQSSPSPKSSGSSVFWGILVTGLLAILAITAGYFKCQSRSDTKGVKLAEEAYPVDQENQGNTLVSVAPLNPPPETQEKPNVNGESPEAAKTQPPPPTNGHSTTKTADTEL